MCLDNKNSFDNLSTKYKIFPFISLQAILVLIALIGVINIEGRHKQIFVRQTPVVNPPHLIQPVRYARPPRFQPASFPRAPRHASARNSVLSHKQSRPVPSVSGPPRPAPAPYVPKQKPVINNSQYVAPQQVRNERQVSAKNYNTPISTHKTKPVNHKKFIPGVAQIIAVEAHQAPEKTSKSVAPAQIRSERQVTTKSYNTPISTDKTSPGSSYQSTPVEAKKPAVTAPQVPAKTPKHVAPKQIRSERQVTTKSYNTPISTEKTTPDNNYKSSPVEVKKPAKVLAKTPKYVAPTQIRSERQVPAKSYNAPLSTYNTAPVTSYKTTPLKAQPSTIQARQVATPRQPSYSATGRSNQEPIAITRYVYNSPTGEEQEGDDVFNYEFETENGIKQR